jgi:ankyrin repeat protein
VLILEKIKKLFGYTSGTRNMEAIQLLIDSGVDVNQKNVIGMSSLLLVASYGDDQLVSTVLQAGADPKATNDFGHSALHIAVVSKRDLLGRLAAQGSCDAHALIDKPLNRRNIDVALRQWALQSRHLVGPGEPDLNRLNQVSCDLIVWFN